MARCHARCRRGEGLRFGVPHGHWNSATLVAGLRRTGMVAPMVLEVPNNPDAFVAYVGQVLVPDLSPGDIVIIKNASSRTASVAREAIEATGASLLFLLPYSPDFNPFRQAFSKLRAHLCNLPERTIQGLWNANGRTHDLSSERRRGGAQQGDPNRIGRECRW